MSAQAGWYPDPGGADGLYRYWDGRVWSAATSPNPSAPPPSQGLGAGPTTSGSSPYGGTGYGSTGGSPDGGAGGGYGTASPYGATGAGSPTAYARYQQSSKKRSGIGWWLAGAALVVAVVVTVVAVLALRTTPDLAGGPLGGGQPSDNTCPDVVGETPSQVPDAQDGRVHGGPISYPQLGQPWSQPSTEGDIPFGSDAKRQQVLDQADYDGNHDWVSSIIVAELQAGDGFFSPQQGAEIVVRCIIGRFYGDAEVTSDVKINQATTIDGRDAWVVESQLSFDIPGLVATGELLIVAIVSAGATSGLYYASIPDTQPELIPDAREAMTQLRVD